MGTVENRQQPRADLALRVEYQKLNTFFADYTKNLSKGGMFIKTDAPLPVGTRLRFSLAVPKVPAPFELEGEVTRSVPAASANGQEAGMGVRFLFDDDARRVAFESQVERLLLDSLGPEIYRQLLGKNAPKSA